MSESSYSQQLPAATAGLAKEERLNVILVTVGILLVLALAVGLLRFHRLSELPLALHNDEGAHGINALQVLQGEHAAFFPENHGREGLIVYAIALSISLLGRTELAIRVPTALASAGSVFVLFWLGQVLFGRDEETGQATPWRGMWIGGVGAALLAVSLGQTIIGRSAMRGNFLPMLLSLSLVLLWRGWRRRSLWRIVLAGVCSGLLPYTYIPARFVPLLFLFFGLSFLFPLGSLTRARIRTELPWVGVFVGIAGLVAAPIVFHFIQHPEHFFFRSNQLLVFLPGRILGVPLEAFLVNTWEHLLALGFRGDPVWLRNIPGRPMLNLWEAFFFWLGAGSAVWRWRQQPAYRLLFLWFWILLLPAMLSIDHTVPNSLRMIGTAPAIYLLAAAGMWETFRFLKEKLFQGGDTWAAIAVGVVITGMVLVQGVGTYRNYFQNWQATVPESKWAYWAMWGELAQVVRAQSPDLDTVYLIPVHSWHYSVEYLDQVEEPAHVVYLLSAPNRVQQVKDELAVVGDNYIAKIVDLNDDGHSHLSHQETERFVLLLGKYGRFLGSEEYANIRIHNFEGISLDRPWTLVDNLKSSEVHYDGGISLHAFAMGQGEEQLSSNQPFSMDQDRSWWLAMQWQTAPGLEVVFSISLRLHDAEGGNVYQRDVVLENSNRIPTNKWPADELVDTLHLLEFPSEIPPGEYELRLVVYDYETLKPTVELGVWEPEVTLARLRWAEGRQ